MPILSMAHSPPRQDACGRALTAVLTVQVLSREHDWRNDSYGTNGCESIGLDQFRLPSDDLSVSSMHALPSQLVLVIQHRNGTHRRSMAPADAQGEAEEGKAAANDLGEIR